MPKMEKSIVCDVTAFRFEWLYQLFRYFFVIVTYGKWVFAADLTPCELSGESIHHERGKKPQKDSGSYANQPLKPADCEELLQLGYTISGTYNVWPKGRLLNGKILRVYCDMETDGGGWTVLQRRGNFLRSEDYFYKDWVSYKSGFGNIEKDFWLGNDNIFVLTNQKLYSVRFDLTDVDLEYKYALYDTFFIDNEENKYKLTIQDYSGTANDSMINGHNLNGQKFTTKDADNDAHKDSNCAVLFKGAWWYNSCHKSNLNGLYLHGKHESFADGINWESWKGHHESLQKTEIKIRSKDFYKNLL